MIAANTISPMMAAALAPLAAGGEHRQPFAPCQPDFVPGKPGQIRCRTHAAAASVSTSAMNMSSRLVSLRPFCWRSSVERALGDQPPRCDDADPVGHPFGHFQNMRGHDHGAAGAHPVAEQALDVTRRHGVEAGERFVEDDQARVVHQGPGQRHLLAHALGKSLAALVQMRLEAERDQEIARGRFGDRGVDAPEPGDEGEIFQRGQLVVDHRLVRHPCRDLLGGDGIGQRIDAEHRHRAGIGPQQAGHHAQRRGLAGAVGPEQRIEFAGSDGEIERIDREAVKTLR